MVQITLTYPLTDEDKTFLRQLLDGGRVYITSTEIEARTGQGMPFYDCGGKRCRYYGEISNTALARELGVQYIGNKEIIQAADEAGIAWTYHGTHPYIRETLKDELVKHLQLSKKTETDI